MEIFRENETTLLKGDTITLQKERKESYHHGLTEPPKILSRANHNQKMTVGQDAQMKKAKYIYYNNSKVYALYYMDENTLYYNTAFEGGAKLYILVGKDKKKDRVRST